MLRGEAARFDFLHPDQIGQLGTQAQARIADLADEIGIAAEQLDALLFAKAKFAQAFAHLRRRGQLFDADRNAGLHLA